MNTHGRCISRLLLTSLILLVSCYGSTTCSALCNLLDRDSLLSLSSQISCPSPLNWSISIDCCSWEGISCDDNGHVTRLWLPSRGLVGSLSPSVPNLSHLAQLNLSQNRLSGPVPDRFFMALNGVEVVDLSFNHFSGNLDSSDSLAMTIEALDLSSNNFVGEIQTSFLQTAINLMNFNLSNNSFHGPFPLFICNFLPSISVLDFSFNNFDGSVDFGRCSNLKVLRAGFNSVTGPLPGDLYAMTTLRELYLPGNRLSGPIGEGIGNLLDLRILALHANEFTGVIPRSIGRLRKLEHLLLHMNKLNGTLPATLGNCLRLSTLNLRNNFILGEFSSFEFSRFLQLRIVDLGNNLFTGSFPATLASCLSLTAIRLSGNQLVGEIPTEIQALRSLSFLSVSDNNFVNITGAISILSGCPNLSILVLSSNFYKESLPNREDLFHFEGFPNIQLLALGGCQFSGKIPNWFSALPRLEVLDLSQNSFTGELPSWLANLPSLFYLDLSQNFFSGILPAELTRLPSLMSQQVENEEHQIALELPVFFAPTPEKFYSMEYYRMTRLPPAIYLNNNNISGMIPSEIGQLKLLHHLNLSHNNLSGTIPDAISALKNLEKLDLSGNQLRGAIPASLRNLHFLSAFSVANNLLEGPIPTGGQFDTFVNTSFEGNPDLCGEILLRPCSKIFATSQPPTKKSLNWLGFHSGFGLGYGISFIVTVVTIATRNSCKSRKARRVYVSLEI